MSTKPGVQKPHWNAPQSMKACCTIDSAQLESSISAVGTLFPPTQVEALQELDQVAMRLDVGRDRLAVEREIDVLHAHHTSSSGWPACARKARSTASAVIGSSVIRTPTAS